MTIQLTFENVFQRFSASLSLVEILKRNSQKPELAAQRTNKINTKMIQLTFEAMQPTSETFLLEILKQNSQKLALATNKLTQKN